MAEYPEDFLELCRSITAKRAKTVIDHLLEHGHITTDELREAYGYGHPPRAARDVRELGIPLETFTVTARSGRKIAAYRFGDLTGMYPKRSAGRTTFSKELKEKLMARHGRRCFIYCEEMEEHLLQIDHRVPYEVAGDDEGAPDTDDFMLLCGSANRAKSWSCEHCENWQRTKDRRICQSCYWASPERYSHVAMQEIRRLDMMWKADEVRRYDELKEAADARGSSMPDFVKAILRRHLSG